MKRYICEDCGRVITYLDRLDLDETDCKGCKKQMVLAYFEFCWYHGGSFMKHLCEAIVVADLTNLAKLYKSFPLLVDGYSVYAHGETWNDRNN